VKGTIFITSMKQWILNFITAYFANSEIVWIIRNCLNKILCLWYPSRLFFDETVYNNDLIHIILLHGMQVLSMSLKMFSFLYTKTMICKLRFWKITVMQLMSLCLPKKQKYFKLFGMRQKYPYDHNNTDEELLYIFCVKIKLLILWY
jgi:hypothetical protein